MYCLRRNPIDTGPTERRGRSRVRFGGMQWRRQALRSERLQWTTRQNLRRGLWRDYLMCRLPVGTSISPAAEGGVDCSSGLWRCGVWAKAPEIVKAERYHRGINRIKGEHNAGKKLPSLDLLLSPPSPSSLFSPLFSSFPLSLPFSFFCPPQKGRDQQHQKIAGVGNVFVLLANFHLFASC